MSTKRINVTTILPPSALFIGYVAENGVTNVEFDVSVWVEMYGSGTATLIMKRWGDANPYPIALEVDNEGLATWTISATDTAKTGFAYAQLRYETGTKVKKSPIYTLKIGESLGSPAEAPDQYEDWIDALTHLAAQAMAEALDLEDIPTDKTLKIDGAVADAKAAGDALALKADKSTTYTKTEVDQMIEDVEVETDTTLAISGAPADAKKVGDELSDIKADLDSLSTATTEDVGKALKAKTITNGKVTEWEFGEAGGGTDALLREEVETNYDFTFAGMTKLDFNIVSPYSGSNLILAFTLTFKDVPSTFSSIKWRMRLLESENVESFGIQFGTGTEVLAYVDDGNFAVIELNGSYQSSSTFYFKIHTTTNGAGSLSLLAEKQITINGQKYDVEIATTPRYGNGRVVSTDQIGLDYVKDSQASIESRLDSSESLLQAINNEDNAYSVAITAPYSSANKICSFPYTVTDMPATFSKIRCEALVSDYSNINTLNIIVFSNATVGKSMKKGTISIEATGSFTSSQILYLQFVCAENSVASAYFESLKIYVDDVEKSFVFATASHGTGTISVHGRKNGVEYEDYFSGYRYFQVPVNTNFLPEVIANAVSDAYTEGLVWCAFRVPTTYTKNGTPTKFAVCMHGAGGTVYNGHAGELTALETLLLNGYAIMDCAGVVGTVTTTGGAEHMGGLIAISAYKSAIDYIMEHYNVEKTIYLHGHSMGGLSALNFMSMFGNLVKVVGLCYPVTDIYNQAWLHPWYGATTKKSIATAYNFEDTTGSTYEAERVVGFNPINNNTVVVGDIRYSMIQAPIRIWHGNADSMVGMESSEAYITALRNAGVFATFREVDGVGHAYGDCMIPELALWFNRF